MIQLPGLLQGAVSPLQTPECQALSDRCCPRRAAQVRGQMPGTFYAIFSDTTQGKGIDQVAA